MERFAEVEQQAFTIAQFAARNGISACTYHKLKNAGHGPREMTVGGAIRISIEAERDWRRDREAPLDEEGRAKANARRASATKAANAALKSPVHVSKRGPKAKG